jgi:hypothetical protein
MQRLTNSVVLTKYVFPKDYTLSTEELIYQKLSKLEDREEEFNIDLIALLNANSVYIATFSYWRWNLKDKQQCKKEDIGAIEEKQIKKERNFYIDFINKEIVIIKCDADYDYDIRITKLKFEDYGKSWAFTRKELE